LLHPSHPGSAAAESRFDDLQRATQFGQLPAAEPWVPVAFSVVVTTAFTTFVSKPVRVPR
jgi:hypothetical protein